MKLTVLHSNYSWLPRTETWLFHQVKHLPPNIESHIVCGATENLEELGLPNIHCFSRTSLVTRLLNRCDYRKSGWRKIREVLLCKRINASILHSHFGPQGWEDLAISRKARCPQVVTFYGYDVNSIPRSNPIWEARYRELFAQVSRVLCEGPHMAKCVIALGCPREKVSVHHLGIPIERYQFIPRIWPGKGPLRVLIAGSFVEKKGIPYAVEALGMLKADVPLEITIIGDVKHPLPLSEKEKILRAVKQAALEGQVSMLGYQPYAALLKQAEQSHLFLAPSVTAASGDTEGGAPVTIIEMAALGVPVVSTFHCDIPHVLADGREAILVTERDPLALAAAMRTLVGSPESMRQMVHLARQKVESAFNAAHQGLSLSLIYENVARGQTQYSSKT